MAADFQALTASAPSKVILHGEHAVVYGMTAVGASLDLRTSITIKPHPSKVVVHFPDLGLSDSWTIVQLKELFRHCPKSRNSVCPDYLNRLHDFLGVDPSNLRMAGVICFLYLYTVILDPDPLAMELHVSSEIPLGAGLGSSAALSVCLAAGLTSVLRQVRREDEWREEPEEICRLAFLSEKILHGTPSGIDNSVSTYGGLCQFACGHIDVLPSPKEKLEIMLVNTQVPRDTKAMVAKVRAQYNAQPKIVRPIMEAIDGISKSFLALLARQLAQEKEEQEEEEQEEEEKEEEEMPSLQSKMEELVAINQSLLEALDLSHPVLQQVLSKLKSFGLTGKLTGAGGGGFAFALVPPGFPAKTIADATQALEDLGFDVSMTRIGGPGYSVKLES